MTKQITLAYREMRRRKSNGRKYSEFAGGNVLAWQKYDQFLREADSMDYDDVLLHARQLLTDRQDIRDTILRKASYMLVDEGQDSNQIQAETISHSFINLSDVYHLSRGYLRYSFNCRVDYTIAFSIQDQIAVVDQICGIDNVKRLVMSRQL